MNRRVAFPFLTLSDSSVSAKPWEVSLDGGSWSEAGDYLPDWAPSSRMRVRKTIRIEPRTASRELSIPQDQLQLATGIRIGTGQGRLPRMILARHRHVMERDDWERELEFEIPGQGLSVVLEMLTEITLASPPRSPSALAPRTGGDRLWSDRTRIRLEGEEPRFPVETADLATLLGGTVAASAPWHLHWSPRDWGRDFHGAVRLYLNEKAPGFLERVKSEDGPTLQVLLADVMGQICERFVFDPDAAQMMQDVEPGSVGAQAVTWLRKAWPGKDPAFIRSVLEGRPGVFHSAFLALAELGEEA